MCTPVPDINKKVSFMGINCQVHSFGFLLSQSQILVLLEFYSIPASTLSQTMPSFFSTQQLGLLEAFNAVLQIIRALS